MKRVSIVTLLTLAVGFALRIGAQEILPRPEQPFKGHIERTAKAIVSAPQGATRPNIVFILVDNIGWGAFGAYGGTIPTPCIDKMASEGIRFNNYNVESQCTPSRSAIMTGRHPVRSGTFTVPFPGQGLAGMAPWEYTIA